MCASCIGDIRKNLRPHFAELLFPIFCPDRAAQADTILSKWRALRLDIVFKRRKRILCAYENRDDVDKDEHYVV